MKAQMDWLNKELAEKTKELMNCRKEQVSKAGYQHGLPESILLYINSTHDANDNQYMYVMKSVYWYHKNNVINIIPSIGMSKPKKCPVIECTFCHIYLRRNQEDNIS